MAHVVMDLDGTISYAPEEMAMMASALRAADHRVTVLTGTSNMPVTEHDFIAKTDYLRSLGFGESYDDIVIISNKVDGGLAVAKSIYLRDIGADVYVDNSTANAEESAQYVPCVLVPWPTRV